MTWSALWHPTQISVRLPKVSAFWKKRGRQPLRVAFGLLIVHQPASKGKFQYLTLLEVVEFLQLFWIRPNQIEQVPKPGIGMELSHVHVVISG